MHRKVDPAALLISILVLGIAPLTTVGLWDKMNTIVAAVVGVVLVAFTWPFKTRLQDGNGQIDLWVITALALVYGFVIAIGTAWLVQFNWTTQDCPPHKESVLPPQCKANNDISNWATNWALGIGLAAAIILSFIMWRRKNKLSQDLIKAFDFAAFKRAYEAKDVNALIGFFADDAEWTGYSQQNPPHKPNRIIPHADIKGFLRQVPVGALTVVIEDEIIAGNRTAFRSWVRQPDGRQIIEHVMLHLDQGKIVRQIVVDASDWSAPKSSVSPASHRLR